jgi:hypothetical protein
MSSNLVEILRGGKESYHQCPHIVTYLLQGRTWLALAS